MLRNKIDITKEETLDFAASIDNARVNSLDTVAIPMSLAVKIEEYLGYQFDRDPVFDPSSNTFK